MNKEQIKNIAVEGTAVKEYAASFPGKIILEYSLELYRHQIDYALEVCHAVMDV